MKSRRKLAFGWLLFALPLNACSEPICSNTGVARIEAPDGRQTAILFQRDCGATTGFTTQISIVKPGEEPSGAGNVFIADAGRNEVKSGAWGGPWVSFNWERPDHLRIIHAAGARIFKQETKADGVRISFQEVGSPPPQ